jgi:conjugative transfer signal peptidase TraF
MSETHTITRRFLRYLVRVMALMVVLWLVWRPLGQRLVLNKTASLPRGLYWIERGVTVAKLRHADLVWVQLPEPLEDLARQRGYLPPQQGSHLLKPVLALPSEQWCVKGSAFTVRGELIGAVLDLDSQGRPLPRLADRCERLAKDTLLVGTAHPRSFDSRYVGPIPAHAVLGRATPLLLWEHQAPGSSQPETNRRD